MIIGWLFFGAGIFILIGLAIFVTSFPPSIKERYLNREGTKNV